MRHLTTHVHASLTSLEGRRFERLAARAIVLRGEDILMLYTQRYDDYTLPGGGIDAGENIEQGLIRELQEETGATNITKLQAFGCYEEFRPWHKDDADLMQMKSYCFTCEIDAKLGATNYEDYEIKNGMKPVWINIFDAIAHNQHTLDNSDKKGMSLARELFLLRLIAKECLTELLPDLEPAHCQA
ncbi:MULTISPECIES: NUDIX hydrolase [unclassified Motilimonas]|uniref:NUDIX hydrolase n=1 Tax=Motilimonas TaxID=1914248 RepID=UPI001E429A08|nr:MULTISPECIES: NUDIX hydrolase [unclassified Motilimonas]MCE0558169.1 NUDIX domain-containing protein [Motilimonas sp. E26]MDO6524528.1 NUDIX hydrolase [Motilimonas sp. 1_MG-2023]